MKKRLIALLIVLALVIPAGIASAAGWYRVNTTSLQVRYLPSTSARVLGSYRKDYALTVRTNTGDGWSYVKFSSGLEGYVQTRYITKGSSYSAWISSDDTALRSGPDGSFKSLANLAKGKKVTVLTHGARYDYVNAGDMGYGYVMNGFLSKKKVASSGKSSTSNAVSGFNYDAYVLNAGYRKVNLRTGPSLNAPIIAEYSTGTKVFVLEHGRIWDKIQVSGNTGYMMTQFLTTSVPAGTPSTTVSRSNVDAYVVNPNGRKVNFRSGASKSASVIAEYDPGTKVHVDEYGSTWSKVTISGQQGYMMTQFLSTSAPTQPGPVNIPSTAGDYTAYVYTNNHKDLNARQGAGNYSVAFKIPYGAAVKVLKHQVVNGWDYIEYNGKKAYVKNAFLQMEKPSDATAGGGGGGGSSTPVNPYPRQMTVTSSNGKSVNVHKQASDNSSNVDFLGNNGRLEVGTVVTVTGVTKGWAHIEYNGKKGWMHAEFLK